MLDDDKTKKFVKDKNTSQQSNSKKYWLKIFELIFYLAFLLFLLVWPVKDIFNHQITLTTLGGIFIIIAFTIRFVEMTSQIIDKRSEVSSTEKTNQITSADSKIFNYMINVGVLILLIFCVISYLVIEIDYQLICLDLETLNSIGILIFGIFWLAQSIEDIIIKSQRKLFSQISHGIGLIFAMLYLPIMLISPALCR